MKDNITKQDITETLEFNYMPYAMSVIISRAIPEIDGFKPSHRKLLYTMYKMGLLNGNRVKSADVVGQTMKLNPHGDGAIYETLVRLTRGNDSLLHPFIDSKGNFGKSYSRDMAYAASRYTEVKLSEICNEVFKNIDKNVVDFIDNYNGSTKEPLLFPTTFPNLLVTPNHGIAVSMASSIASFNLKEVCNTTIEYIKNKNIDITKYLLAPDFSTGGELMYDKKELEKIYSTGRGSLKLRSKYHFDKKNSCIEIYEIPYSTTIESIIDKIVALIKSGKIKEISDVRDETDLKGLKICIDIKRNANPHILMQKLFSSTTLSDTFSCNFNLLINSKPRTMGIIEILDEWVAFRKLCLSRQLTFDIEKKSEKLKLLIGLSKIISDIDKAIKIIRETTDDGGVIPNLIKAFDIDENQAEYICEIKLRNLNKEYLLKRINEKSELENELKNLRYTLDNEEEIEKLICSQLKEISKKYGSNRRTDIIYEELNIEIPKEDFIEDYNLKLFLTQDNYLKKISLASLRSSSEQNLKENDFIIREIETNNKIEVLFFSDKSNMYKIKAHELPSSKASLLGEYLPNMLNMDKDEKIFYMTVTADYSGYMIYAFENGKMAKIPLSAYQTKLNRKKLLNVYSDKSPLIFTTHITEDTNLLALRDNDKALLFSTSLIPEKSTKNSVGVQVYKLKKNSIISKVMDTISLEGKEYYRTSKIPHSGQFIKESDKNSIVNCT